MVLQVYDPRGSHLNAPKHSHHLQNAVIEGGGEEDVSPFRTAPEVGASHEARNIENHNPLNIINFIYYRLK